MSDNLFELYSQKILNLATEIPRIGAMEDADAHAKKRSPICGSEVEAFIKLDGDVISDYSHIVNACALGQASASIFAQAVVGTNQAQIEKLETELEAFLKSEGPAPSAPFDDYKYLEPAQKHKNRHGSILLAVKTTLDALNS